MDDLKNVLRNSFKTLQGFAKHLFDGDSVDISGIE